jgi:hypothetical protein
MKTLPFVSAVLITASAHFACSSSSLGIHDAEAGAGQPGVGGSVASGGILGAGGVPSSGGKSGSGGVLGSGGTTSLGGSGGTGMPASTEVVTFPPR